MAADCVDTVGLLVAVKVYPSENTPKAFDFGPYIPGRTKDRILSRKDEREERMALAVQSAGGNGSSAPTPKDGDGGAGSSAQPPKQKMDDGCAEYPHGQPRRLLLDAWSTT